MSGDGPANAHGRYQALLGCDNITLSNTTGLYARYSMSFVCNAIIQNSIVPCALSTSQSYPLCATSCVSLSVTAHTHRTDHFAKAAFALSEQMIVSSPQLCGTPDANAITQLRADFTNCALPAGSIADTCVPGYVNEGTTCGFQNNLDGLCTYCNTSSLNATDSCCVTSNAGSRCANVRLPTFTSMQPLFLSSSVTSPDTTSPTRSASGPATGVTSNPGLSGGQIAGIVVGSILGAAFLLGLVILGCVLVRRRSEQEKRSSLNQPSPTHQRSISSAEKQASPPFVPLGGARVTRLAAMDGSPPIGTAYDGTMRSPGSSTPTNVPSNRRGPFLGAAVVGHRGGSALETPMTSSPLNEASSPEGTSGSEQLNAFKDYYSQDEIRPGDAVSTLWDYQPRANDEFGLERGDMLRVVGIWDDGWATGVRIPQHAQEWESVRHDQRDSVVSGTSRDGGSPAITGEIKAFPVSIILHCCRADNVATILTD